MKVARWERNQSNPEKVKAGRSRNNWNTSGMMAHIVRLENILKRPAKRPLVFSSTYPTMTHGKSR